MHGRIIRGMADLTKLTSEKTALGAPQTVHVVVEGGGLVGLAGR